VTVWRCRLALALAALTLLSPATSLAESPRPAGDPPSDTTEAQALDAAESSSVGRETLRDYPRASVSASREEEGADWEVRFFVGERVEALVIVDPVGATVREEWTGEQVAWTMARGYPGAFGRTLNAPWVWIPLCLIFFCGLFDWRRPFRVAHLDLLALTAGLGLSHYFFNLGRIDISVPLVYPVLIWLLARMIWLATSRGGHDPRGGLAPSIPAGLLAVAAFFLIGVRIAFNMADSNVIDVGYAGVIGGDLISSGRTLYANFPVDIANGDTYGPLSYFAYVPFELAFPWRGSWDDLPAAHAAAIFFDLGAMAALFLLGRRLGSGSSGTRLGVLLVFAWAACPYTAFALESNTNDSLVALTVVAILLGATSAPIRGALVALASATKLAPLALVPLFLAGPSPGPAATSPPVGNSPLRRLKRFLAPLSLRESSTYLVGFAVGLIVVFADALYDSGPLVIFERTIGNQIGRDSPFSIWGQFPLLEPLQFLVMAAIGLFALGVAIRPRFRDTVGLAALAAAVLIGVEITFDHWFYLYLPWFLGPLFVALLARDRLAGTRRAG
jgi:hypothetical protein